jgi:dienelactone hydrolase
MKALPRTVLSILAAAVARVGAGRAAAQDTRPVSSPAEALAAAVARANPQDRRRAAAALAARSESIDDWTAVAKSFGNYPKTARGVLRETDRLSTGETSVEQTILTYIPSNYDPARPAPLLLALHGTAGAGEDMIEMWRPIAERAGCLVVANTEPLAKEGYTFKPEERRAALSSIRRARLQYNIDENRIFCTGVSRGGHLAWDTALRTPDLYAGIFPMIGGPWAIPSGGRANLRYLPSILHLTIRDLQGSKDDPGLVALLRYAFDKLKQQKAVDAELIEFPDLGHSFQLGAVDWIDLIQKKTRNPMPGSVVVTTSGKHDSSRAFWAEILTVTKDVQEEFTPKLNQADAAKVNAMDAQTRSRWWCEQAEKHTAKLEVSMTAPGQFVAKGTGVGQFRILLALSMFEPGKPVRVQYNGKTKTVVVKPEKKILLEEFCERFDRTFLPVAEVRVE